MSTNPTPTSYSYPLFRHMDLEHNLTLTDGELDEICRILHGLSGSRAATKREQELEARLLRVETALRDALSVYGDKPELTITGERIEAWQAALEEPK